MKPIDLAKVIIGVQAESIPYQITSDQLKSLCESYIRLHEALSFYAELPEDYYGPKDDIHYLIWFSKQDHGQRARDALAEGDK